MKTKICEAINNKQLLKFTYDDYSRTVEPHLVGLNSAGNVVLSAYLVAGFTESDKKPYWRLYRLDEMTRIEILDDTFTEPRKGYNPNDSRMQLVYCRLPKTGGSSLSSR